MVITNQYGGTVLDMTASLIEPISKLVVLRPGRYRLRLYPQGANGHAAPNMSAVVRYAVLDDPIGPRPTDTTEDPSGDSGSSDSDVRFYWTGRDVGGQGPLPDAAMPHPAGDP